jgi:hypothetical protein
MAYPPQPPYQPINQMGGGTGFPGGAPSARDGITAALMNSPAGVTEALRSVNNPAPGYLSPPGIGGQQPPTPPFGGIPGGAQPQAALGPAAPPMGPMGAIGGPQIPGLNLPGVTQPGVLPPAMNPLGVLGGTPQSTAPRRPY